MDADTELQHHIPNRTLTISDMPLRSLNPSPAMGVIASRRRALGFTLLFAQVRTYIDANLALIFVLVDTSDK